MFAFSHAEPLEGFYGPEAMYGNGFNGPRLTVVRWSYDPETWEGLLKRHGFTDIRVDIVQAPDPDHVGTLIGTARVP
ncbi:hypothetical protein [Streptacidiphilus sp. EB129]|uniref:hypothetical protein n=1 Tax=Streptacidiphilus sp. EB129 TaxID=3156262 RepID=UPI003517B2FD